MTIKEASQYSKIGVNRLRKIVKDKDCRFAIRVGERKYLIKVDEFKKWLDETEYV